MTDNEIERAFDEGRIEVFGSELTARERPLADDPVTVQDGVNCGLQLAEMTTAKARVGQKVATALLDALKIATNNPRLASAAVEITSVAHSAYLDATTQEAGTN